MINGDIIKESLSIDLTEFSIIAANSSSNSNYQWNFHLGNDVKSSLLIASFITETESNVKW